jgi:ribonuclease HII
VTRFRIGADENGLGPRLGPLIITAVLAEVTDAGHKLITRAPRGKLAELLGDSKALLAHGDVALGEAWARVLVARQSTPGRRAIPLEAQTVDDVVHAIAMDDAPFMRRKCPESAHDQCWSIAGEVFEAEPALLKAVSRALDDLEKKGVRVTLAQSAVVCTNVLNEQAKKGITRFHVDLHAMERLVLMMRESVGEEVLAICGKVGGLGHYLEAFGPLAGRLATVLAETRLESAYRVAGLGEIRFVVDADSGDRLVSLSSLVGKWMREILMSRITRHYQSLDESVPSSSGYHDPNTAKFIAATSLLRRKNKIPDDCFERRRAEPRLAVSGES